MPFYVWIYWKITGHSRKASRCYQYEDKHQCLAQANFEVPIELVTEIGIPTFNIGSVWDLGVLKHS